jgi:hypothetical protein
VVRGKVSAWALVDGGDDPVQADDMIEYDRPPALPDQPPITNPVSRVRSRAVGIARWSGVAVSIVSVVFALLTYFGFWNYFRSDTLLEALAARLDLSYAEVNRVVRPEEPEWRPLLRVIASYTHVDLPRDKEPVVFARGTAIASAKADFGEWTAPTTPIVLIYKQWPGQGDLKPKDYRIVGTIQDLHEWVRKDETDFDFVCRPIILGILSACVGTFLAL